MCIEQKKEPDMQYFTATTKKYLIASVFNAIAGEAVENSGQKPPNHLPHTRHHPPSSQLCGWKYKGLNMRAAQPLTYPRVGCLGLANGSV